ncbi:hypothetical protein HDU76_001106 [Blyttiomyces sp. JEL0837]|nr:hypothetical protein HDU76_001106 [Blyttiomyces sp. JEL0837]
MSLLDPDDDDDNRQTEEKSVQSVDLSNAVRLGRTIAMVKRRKREDLPVKKKLKEQIIPISRGTLALCVLMDHLPEYPSPKFHTRILTTCRSTSAYQKFDTNVFRSINHLVMIETTQQINKPQYS